MGLTIHYNLKSKHDDAKATVHQMRQLALDLPFEEVGEIVEPRSASSATPRPAATNCKTATRTSESLFWLLIQAGQHVDCPWNKRISRTVNPTHIIAFDTWPGPGSEAANFGLCLYPAEIEWEYQAEDDERFEDRRRTSATGSPGTNGIAIASGIASLHPVASGATPRPARCRRSWRAGDGVPSAKPSTPATRRAAASPTSCECHISVITLLDRMAKLPGLKVTVDDEGKYGPSTYSRRLEGRPMKRAASRPIAATRGSTTRQRWRRKSASGTR